MFKKRENVLEIEEGNLLSPKFDNDGLIPVITMCSQTKDVLMHGYMNSEALKKTIETKEAYYWSRSRKEVWHKGKTSGFVQKVIEIRIDDDQDSVWMNVDIGDGASCHVGYKSCFYRAVPLGKIQDTQNVEMKFKDKQKNQIKRWKEIIVLEDHLEDGGFGSWIKESINNTNINTKIISKYLNKNVVGKVGSESYLLKKFFGK